MRFRRVNICKALISLPNILYVLAIIIIRSLSYVQNSSLPPGFLFIYITHFVPNPGLSAVEATEIGHCLKNIIMIGRKKGNMDKKGGDI